MCWTFCLFQLTFEIWRSRKINTSFLHISQGKCIKRNQTYNLPFQTSFISVSVKPWNYNSLYYTSLKAHSHLRFSHWSCTRIWGDKVSNKEHFVASHQDILQPFSSWYLYPCIVPLILNYDWPMWPIGCCKSSSKETSDLDYKNITASALGSSVAHSGEC